MAIDECQAAWVDRKVSALDPSTSWQPSARGALQRLNARNVRRRARIVQWTWRTSVAASVLMLLIALVPPMRVAAQRAWDVLFARDVEVLRIDMAAVPPAVWDALHARVATERIRHQSAADAGEASRLAGFRVSQLPDGLLSGTPAWAVVSPVHGELVLSVGALRRAAESTNATDVLIPPEWEGARIRVATGPMVSSEYGDTTLMQTTPIEIAVPPGFDVPAFVSVAFRLLGFDAAQAASFSQQVAAAPVAFLGIGRGERVHVTELPVGRGMGTLIRDLDEGELTLIWGSTDRLYLLTGPVTAEDALAVAAALE